MSLISENPFDCLKAMDAAVKSLGVALPRNEVEKQEFAGIGFQLGSDTLMVKIDDIKEIVEVPECTHVHGTRPWFLGLANVRGSLLPITDLFGYITGESVKNPHTARVLIFEKEGVFAGLKVDQILGLKHFYVGEELPEISIQDKNIQKFIDEQYAQEGAIWSVFNIKKCVTDESFTLIKN